MRQNVHRNIQTMRSLYIFMYLYACKLKYTSWYDRIILPAPGTLGCAIDISFKAHLHNISMFPRDHRIVFVIIHGISLDTYFLLLKIANAFVLDTLSKNLELRHKLQRIVISSQNLRYYFDHQYFNRSICDLNLFIYLEN